MAESSSPLIACPNCGKLFKWKPKLAGHKVNCTGCEQPMRMPKTGEGQFEPIGGLLKDKQDLKKLNEESQGAYELALSDSAVEDKHMNANAGRKGAATSRAKPAAPTNCPACNSKLKPGAVICINCGYHVAEGKKVDTEVGGGGDGNKKTQRAKSEDDMAALTGGAYSGLTEQFKRDAVRQDDEQKRMRRQRLVKKLMVVFVLVTLGVAAFIALRTFGII